MSIFERVDLSKHGVIEASAGTGKTYTIEQLFLRILCSENIAIDKILVLTYTEKATSELKMRIRSGIEGLLKESSGKQKEQLEQALDCFDTASIHTIHGFCNRVLAEYAFENRSLFEIEFVDEKTLIEEVYRDVLRLDLPCWDMPLDLLMELGGWSNTLNEFDEIVFKLASRYRKENGDQIIPRLDSLNMALSRLRKCLGDLYRMLGGKAGVEFIQWYALLPFNATSRGSNLSKALKPLASAFERFGCHDEPMILKQILTIQKWINSFDQGPSRLRPNKYNKGFEEDLETANRLEELILSFEGVFDAVDELSGMLTIYCVEKIFDRAQRVREEEALHSFQDLIEGVRIALRDSDSEILNRLRMQYSFALIDEFQDTDPGQWEILSRVFLDGTSNSKLYLVGDPKQAIYAFRGADLATYERAINAMRELTGKADFYTLDLNFRSTPQFLSPLNQIFSNTAWFGNTRYSVMVSAPEAHLQRHNLQGFPAERGAVNLINLKLEKKERNLQQLARFIADEIAFLNQNPNYLIQKDDGHRLGDWGDFCVLIRSRSDLVHLKQAFVGIPHFVYKKPGIFCSFEALELGCVLSAISRPVDEGSVRLALLTSPLGWDLFDLDSLLDPTMAEPIYRLFARWRELALRKDWGNLFSSLLRETRLGPLGTMDSGWDERVTTFTQIMEILLVEARRRSLDLPSMIEFLNRLYHKDEVLGEDATYHRLAEEEGKVRVMTIHASKGLEFPVVFLFNLFGDDPDSMVHHARQGEQGYQYYLNQEPQEAKDLFSQERRAGLKRLYYVAFTRAQHALYLPRYDVESVQNASRGLRTSSFYKEVIEPCFSSIATHSSTCSMVCEGSRSTEPIAQPTPTTSIDHQPTEFLAVRPDFLNPLENLDLYARSGSGIESFSSMRKRGTVGQSEVSRLFSDQWIEPEERPSVPIEPQRSNELPGGWQVGSMLHKVLENLDFQKLILTPGLESGYKILLEDPQYDFLSELILSCCAEFGFSADYLDEILRLIWATLLTPLSDVGAGFRLLKLSSEQMIREPEFFLSLEDQAPLVFDHAHEGYLHGFIDLVFEYQERVYLVDWKSNRVEEGYQRDALQRLMEEEDYVLQYQIYSLALLRWLQWKLGEDFAYEKHFGGILYLFLRGMNPDNEEGVFFYRPSSEDEVQNYLKIIQGRGQEAEHNGSF